MADRPMTPALTPAEAMRVEQIGDCTLYLGDCRDILPGLGPVDAVVTDPPYGIGFKYSMHNDDEDEWFQLMNDVIPQIKKMARFAIMPSCAINRLYWWYLNHKPDWIVAWYKGSPGHLAKIGFNDWEPHVCWGRPNIPMHDYFATECGFDVSGHPCPKPIKYANWLVARSAGVNQTVVDPFMGSGTTGVACVQQGRRFIGIELDPGYFDIACRRIADEVARPRLAFDKPPEPKQEALL